MVWPSDAVVWLHVALLLWLLIFLPTTMDSAGDAVQVACATVGILAMLFTFGQDAIIFRYTARWTQRPLSRRGV